MSEYKTLKSPFEDSLEMFNSHEHVFKPLLWSTFQFDFKTFVLKETNTAKRFHIQNQSDLCFGIKDNIFPFKAKNMFINQSSKKYYEYIYFIVKNQSKEKTIQSQQEKIIAILHLTKVYYSPNHFCTYAYKSPQIEFLEYYGIAVYDKYWFSKDIKTLPIINNHIEHIKDFASYGENSFSYSNDENIRFEEGLVEKYGVTCGVNNEIKDIKGIEKEHIEDVYYFYNKESLDISKYNSIKNMIINKKNIILQGPPGVGKTYAAKKIAKAIISGGDNTQGKNEPDQYIKSIQFHQSYSYEDFIVGYRPTESGFTLKPGVFYKFCIEAAKDKTKLFFFIIDEINRGNLSKIFGESLMLIEHDKRGREYSLELPFSTINRDEKNFFYAENSAEHKTENNNIVFYIPENVYIIGMMNTADRSLALLDYALRRRFSFINFEPRLDVFKIKLNEKGLTADNSILYQVIERVEIINNAIAEHPELGKIFCIGHSFFVGKEDKNVENIIDYDIMPLLEEYFIDGYVKINEKRFNLNEKRFNLEDIKTFLKSGKLPGNNSQSPQ